MSERGGHVQVSADSLMSLPSHCLEGTWRRVEGPEQKPELILLEGSVLKLLGAKNVGDNEGREVPG